MRIAKLFTTLVVLISLGACASKPAGPAERIGRGIDDIAKGLQDMGDTWGENRNNPRTASQQTENSYAEPKTYEQQKVQGWQPNETTEEYSKRQAQVEQDEWAAERERAARRRRQAEHQEYMDKTGNYKY